MKKLLIFLGLAMVPSLGFADRLGGIRSGTEVLLSTQASTAGVINTSTNPVDWSKLKNVPAGFSDGVDNTGGGGGTTITIQEGGATVVESSTVNFNSAQFSVTDISGIPLVVIDTNTAGGIMALSTGTNAAGQLLRLDSNADVPDANLSASVSLLGSQIDISAETNAAANNGVVLTDDTFSIDWSSAISRTDVGAAYQPLDATLTDLANAPLSEDNSIAVGAIAAGTLPTDVMASSNTRNITSGQMADSDHGDVSWSGGVATIDANTVALGADTTGIYVASLTVTSPITLSGSNDAESAAPILGLTQNAGTDITADLEEETHASEHQDGGGDEIAVTAGMMNAGSGASATTFWRGDNTWATPAGGGSGASTLAVGTGTATNFTNNITSPTAAISFHGNLFRATTNGTTSFISIDTETASGLLPKDLAATTYQPLDATLTDLASAPLSEDNSIAVGAVAAGTLPTDVMASSITVSAFFSDVDVRSNLGLAIGTNVQAYDADLDDLADGSLTGSKVGSGVPAANIASGILGNGVVASSAAVNMMVSSASATMLVSSFPVTGVTAGSYTSANITVDAQGRISSAANGSGGAADNLGDHVATMTITAGFGINATTVAVTDEAYGAGWNGSTFVPTRNAVYDKIETLTAGSGVVATATTTWSGENTWTSSNSFVGVATVTLANVPSFQISQNADVSYAVAEGLMAWDTDNDGLWMGTGSGQRGLISGTTIQVFTTTGTYTPNARMVFAQVIAIGGGGAGPLCANTDSSGGGGGGGGVSIITIPRSAIGTSTSVSIGAAATTGSSGAPTVFGSTIALAFGGTVGQSTNTSTTVGVWSLGGAGATTTGAIGKILHAGSAGAPGVVYSTTHGAGGEGGDAVGWGRGGAAVPTDTAGNAGVGYGGGGGGCHAPGTTDRNGGTGAAGAVIIIEYLAGNP